jgi:hypothetical protein
VVRLIFVLALLAVAIAVIGRALRDLVIESRRGVVERDLERRALERERDARCLPGGTRDNPIDIETPSVVEPMAGEQKCLRCASNLRLEEHAAERHDGDRLRIARMKCVQCGKPRELFFRLQAPRLH